MVLNRVLSWLTWPTTWKARDLPWLSNPLRSSAARSWLSHCTASWRPFGRNIDAGATVGDITARSL
jgi:hypothetical protein